VVRPTEERVREALFSILGDRVKGGRFLDLFAGSGAVGLEALSRGAGAVCWVESSRRVLPILRENVRRLTGLGAASGRMDSEAETQVVAGDAVRFLKKGLVEEAFDLIFADPPYGRVPAGRRASGMKAERNTVTELLSALGAGGLVTPGGVFAMETRGRRQQAPAAGGDEKAKLTGVEGNAGAGWRLVTERVYGNARLSFFERKTRRGV